MENSNAEPRRLPGGKTLADDAKTLADDSQTVIGSRHATNAPDALHAPHIPDHELLRRIGRGSYGEVWLARNVMGTYRAVKIVYRATFEHARPFEREFTGIKKFEPISRSHDGLVDILQVGRTDEYFYYVMELADDGVIGQEIDPQRYEPKTLRSEVAERKRLPFEKCVELGISLSQALGHMHKHGLIHRDIKPSNIIFVHGQPKLADIGLVAEQSEAKSFVGTEGFIPPEGPGAPQGDIYSLGKVLYEIATGKDRHEFPELPTFLSESKTDTGLLELNSVFLKACKSDVKERYQTAEQMREDLLLLQSGKSVKRAQAVERRLHIVSRAGVIGAALTVLAAIAYFGAIRQAQRATRAEQEVKRQLYVSDMTLADKAVSEGNIRRAEELLNVHVPTAGGTDLRGLEYYYLKRLCEGDQVFSFPKEATGLFAIAFSPDGRVLATGSSYWERRDYSGNLKLFDIATRTEIATMTNTDGACSLAFSPGGKLLASGNAGSVVTLWDAARHEKVHSFFANAGPAMKLAFSPDGSFLAALFYGAWINVPGKIVCYDLRTQKERTTIDLRASYCSSLALSADGNTLAFADDLGDHRFVLRAYDARSEKIVAEIPSPFDGDVLCLDLSANSNTVAFGGSSGFLGLWNLERARVDTLGKHQHSVSSINFSANGTRLLSASGDGSIKLWDPLERKELRLFKGHNNQVSQVMFSPDGASFASAGRDGTARLWRLEPDQSDVLKSAGPARAVAFAPNGRLIATGGSDPVVRVWDPATGKEHASFVGQTNTVISIAFSPDGRYIAAGSADRIGKLWDFATGRELATFASRRGPLGSLVFSPDSKLLVWPGWGTAQIWDVAAGRAITNLSGHSTTVSACFSPDGKYLATANDAIRIWESGSWKFIRTMSVEGNFVKALAFAADSKTLAAVRENSTIKLWNVENGRELGSLTGSVGSALALTILPGGKTIAAGEINGDIKLWNLATLQELFTLHGHNQSVGALAASSDGAMLASASADGTVRLWRTAIARVTNAASQKDRKD